MTKSLILSMFLILGSIFLFSCASVPKASESADLEAKNFTPLTDKGSVFPYRPGRVLGAAFQYQVKVNSIDAGGTGPGTYFRWDLKPGTYSISSSTTESSATVQVKVEAGKLYFYEQNNKIGFMQGGRIFINEVDEKTGKAAVTESKLLVSAYLPEE